MKKIIGLLMCMMALAMGACTRVPADDIAPPPAETASAEPTALETEEPPSLPSAEPSLEPEETPETTEEPSPSPSATSSGPRMYSSYAHLVSYDPARGFADFDYFDLLQGEKAVAYLVETEGYTLAEAQARVSEFADSEFIEKNTSPQLRTIDLRDVQIKLLYRPDGTMVTGAEPINATLADFYAVYHIDRRYIVDYHFYYITVSGGEVVRVAQVYWP